MSLEAQIEVLNKNILALIGVIGSQANPGVLQANPAPVKAGQADPAVIASAEKAIAARAAQKPADAPQGQQEAAQAPSATYAMVKSAFQALVLSKGRDVGVELLTKLGYPNGLKALETAGTPEQFAQLLDEFTKAGK